MKYTEGDLRHFLYLFRAYGTKPYIDKIYMQPNDVMKAVTEPDKHNVGRTLMSCIAYYLHLGLDDDHIVAYFMKTREVLGHVKCVIDKRDVYNTISGLDILVGDGLLEVHHVTRVLSLVIVATNSKGFDFDFSYMFEPDGLSTMISLAIHTPSRLQYHPRALEICEGIHRICKSANKKIGHREGERIINKLIKKISVIKTDTGGIEIGKLRFNYILKKILELYSNSPDIELLIVGLSIMYSKDQKFSMTYADMDIEVLLNDLIDFLEINKKFVNKIDFSYSRFARIVLSYFDALCSRVGIDIFEAIIKNQELHYSSPEEEGWII